MNEEEEKDSSRDIKREIQETTLEIYNRAGEIAEQIERCTAININISVTPLDVTKYQITKEYLPESSLLFREKR